MLLRIWKTQVGGVVLPNTMGLIVIGFVLMLVLLFAHLAYGKRSLIGRLVFPLISRLMR